MKKRVKMTVGNLEKREDRVISTKDYKGFVFMGIKKETHTFLTALDGTELHHLMFEINEESPTFVDMLIKICINVKLRTRLKDALK